MKIALRRMLGLPSSRKIRRVRGREGWHPNDVWSLESYLSKIIGESVLYLAEHGHGWPPSEEFPTYESWTSFLREQGNALMEWVNWEWSAYPKDIDMSQGGSASLLHDPEFKKWSRQQNAEEERRLKAAKTALHKLVNHWEALWD